MTTTLDAQDLLLLAQSRHPADRERLLVEVVDLCDAAEADALRSPVARELVGAVFMKLVAEAERDIRRRLAEKIGPAPWAPPALVNVLALDEIEIAAPVIASSPVLQDHDLIRMLVECTLDHQIAIARRGRLGAPVIEAILKQEEPAVLTALAGNDTAELTPSAMERLVEHSRKIAAMRSPLARHPRLSSDMAQRLYLWVGQSLRSALIGRFRLDPEIMDAELALAVREAHAAIDGLPPAQARSDAEREAMEARLVEKLAEGDQLKPGYLLRALREGRLTLFVAALAKLGGFEPEHIRRAIDSDRPELLGLACAAIGVDRGVFPTILEAVRALNHGRPGGGAEGQRRAAGAFGPFDADIAGMAFRQAVKSV
ncbi:DUF2336 domain-containing protein [Caulobacter mirabilis]|uniref:DUF2336 domain-containing protein n=1 Tax=Caulobacter mirabilis TaxID=69666 RepID=UPI0026AF4C73